MQIGIKRVDWLVGVSVLGYPRQLVEVEAVAAVGE